MSKNALEDLRRKILLYNEAYEKGDPIVDDITYDFYKKQLKILEKQESEAVSNQIGSSSITNKAEHLYPILSLAHDFGSTKIEKFINKIEKKTAAFPLIAELKIDGISLIAKYVNGHITQLKTRGNGIYGENISHLIQYINIPEQIQISETIEIRFEAYLEKNIIKNSRNAAAGILLKKLPDPLLKFLKLAPHNLYSTKQIWNSYEELRKIFANLNLKPIEPYAICSSLEDCRNYFHEIESAREKLSHEIDGIVFKVDSYEKQQLLGNTFTAPRFAFAIKFSNAFNIAKILDIKFQVGRQGKVTPLAIITPTEINEKIIRKATLHNLKDLEKKQIAIGDVVKIEMAGDVIPQITDIIEKTENRNTLPSNCPSCNTKLNEDTCPNSWDCPEQKLNKLLYFASKNSLNIENIGEKQIIFFIKQNILNYPNDFFELKNTVYQIKETPNWLGKKYFTKLIANIEKSKYVNLEQFIISLGLPNIARSKAKEIVQNFHKFEDFLNSTEEELLFLGENNSKNVYQYKEIEKDWIIKAFQHMKCGQKQEVYSLFERDNDS